MTIFKLNINTIEYGKVLTDNTVLLDLSKLNICHILNVYYSDVYCLISYIYNTTDRSLSIKTNGHQNIIIEYFSKAEERNLKINQILK